MAAESNAQEMAKSTSDDEMVEVTVSLKKPEKEKASTPEAVVEQNNTEKKAETVESTPEEHPEEVLSETQDDNSDKKEKSDGSRTEPEVKEPERSSEQTEVTSSKVIAEPPAPKIEDIIEDETQEDNESITTESTATTNETPEVDAEEEHAESVVVKDEGIESNKPDEETAPESEYVQSNEETQRKDEPKSQATTEVREEFRELPKVEQSGKVGLQSERHGEITEENLKNTIKEIILDIDTNIKDEANIAMLKQDQLELYRKQQELAHQVRQQQLLSEQLLMENRLQKLQLQQNQEEQERIKSQILQQPIQSYAGQSPKPHNYMESSYATNKVDLQKIFTPATDGNEILPKNRKLYASSAFYSPTLHPTVEDQIELARRISSSLSDINNERSKGQSMYVNRKKRSEKWVHEGCGQDFTTDASGTEGELKETGNSTLGVSAQSPPLVGSMPLKLLMNPRGQMLDFTSVKESFNTESGLLSPENCAEVVAALQGDKGKGAELFAKRRKKAENWVVDETSATGIQCPSDISDFYNSQPKAAVSPSIIPAYSDAGKHRVQLNVHQEQVLEKYAKPGIKVVKTPWEAALETGSASTAFVDDHAPHTPVHMPRTPTPRLPSAPPSFQSNDYFNPPASDMRDSIKFTPSPREPSVPSKSSNLSKELAYKPSLPQGWKSPGMTLPRDLFMPKDIPLECYAPPPSLPNPVRSSPTWYPDTQRDTFSAQYTPPSPKRDCFTSPPKRQYLDFNRNETLSPSGNQVPTVNFSPSPLSFDKLARFENNENETNYYGPPWRSQNRSPLNSRKFKLNNTSKPVWAQRPMSSSNFGSSRSPGNYSGSQNFNTSAVGWGRRNAPEPTLITTGELPYTDF